MIFYVNDFEKTLILAVDGIGETRETRVVGKTSAKRKINQF